MVDFSLRISVMKEADTAFAHSLTEIEKWGYLEDDFKRLICFEPEGCFIAWKNQERVGMVTTTSYGNYAFLGCLIVKQAERGQGIGERLMNHAVEFLKSRGAKTIELDGVFAAASLYRKLGFKDKYLSLRFRRKAQSGNDIVSPCSMDTIDEIVNFDREKTGLNRERMIREYFNRPDALVLAVRREGIGAYAIARPRSGGFFTIGPMVANGSANAEKLYDSIIEKSGFDDLTIGVPEVNKDAIGILVRKAFQYGQPSLRMYLGDKRNYERYIFGIFSAEKG